MINLLPLNRNKLFAMNWKLLGVIGNTLSVVIWLVVLIFVKQLSNFYFSFLQNDILLPYHHYIYWVILFFVVMMILLNLITIFLAAKSEQKLAMLWLIGLTYFQFLLTVGVSILLLGVFMFGVIINQE